MPKTTTEIVKSFIGIEIIYSEELNGRIHIRVAPPIVDRKAMTSIGLVVIFLSLDIANGECIRGPHNTDSLNRIE